MFSDEKIKSFTKEEVKLGDVTFRFDKMNAMKGFKTFELIRKELSNTLSNVQTDTDDKGLGVEFIKAILGLDVEFMDTLRETMFTHVKFKGNGAQNYVDLKGSEDMAFQQLSPASIYEVYLRALAVNFTDTLNELKSKFASQA